MKIFTRFCFLGIFIFLAPAVNSAQETDTAVHDAIIELPSSQETITRGKQLFMRHCNICHAVEYELIGPALASIPQKRPLPWLLDFIKNSQEVIRSGDEYAVNLYDNYDRLIMPAFEFLADDEVLAILAYVQSESVPENARVGTGASHIEEGGASSPVSGHDYTTAIDERDREDVQEVGFFNIVLFIIIAVSLAILGFLSVKIFRHVR